MSESESDVYHESSKVHGDKSNRKQTIIGKRKSTKKTSSITSKIAKSVDIFGLSHERSEPTTGPPVLSSFFVNRVANGTERRSAPTSGDYYIDFKVYKTSDAQDTESLELWKKALVRVKFQTNGDSVQWRKIQEFVRSADTLFDEKPIFNT